VPLFVVALTSTRASGTLGLGRLARRLCRPRADEWPDAVRFYAFRCLSADRVRLLRGRLHARPVLVAICVGLVVSAISLELISRLRLPSNNRTTRARRWK
jgi:hypothetical protein